MMWFDRYYSSSANPKWLRGHVAELCYYIMAKSEATPPAQLLRPVELPCKVSCDGFNLKEVDDARGKGRCEGFNTAIDACREALRQQGYEVKND